MSWIEIEILTAESSGVQYEDELLKKAMQQEPGVARAWIDCDLMQHFYDCGNGMTKICMQNGEELITPQNIDTFAERIGLKE